MSRLQLDVQRLVFSPGFWQDCGGLLQRYCALGDLDLDLRDLQMTTPNTSVSCLKNTISLHLKAQHTLMTDLSLVPCFQLLLVLQSDPLVLFPHLLHDPGQVLTLWSVDIHVDADLCDLGSYVSNLLLKKKLERLSEGRWEVFQFHFHFSLSLQPRDSFSDWWAPPSETRCRSPGADGLRWCHLESSSVCRRRPLLSDAWSSRTPFWRDIDVCQIRWREDA